MITFIYQLILFFIIIGTYALMRGGYMDIEWNFYYLCMACSLDTW